VAEHPGEECDMNIVNGLVGMGTTVGAALTGQLVIALTVVAVVVLVL
jgi:hypothetical protein